MYLLQIILIGFFEYKNQHTPHATFFNLDNNSKKNTDLPHMLVEKKEWDEIVSKMGMIPKKTLNNKPATTGYAADHFTNTYMS